MQQNLIRGLVNLEFEVCVLTWSHVQLNKIDIPGKVRIIPSNGSKCLSFFSEIQRIRTILLEENINVAILFGTSEKLMIASKLAGVKCVTTLRVDPRFPKKALIKRIRRGLVLSYSDAIVFQTNRVRNSFNQSIKKKSVVIMNPVPRNRIRKEIDFTERSKSVVAFGRLSEEKRFDILIRAFKRVRDEEYKLFLYGEGPERPHLQELIKDMGLCSRVFLLGFCEDPYTVMLNSRIFVLSSEMEGMPNALIEALSHGMACIATNVPSGGTSEIINHGKNGILVEVNSIKEIQVAIERLISDFDFCEQLGSNARKINQILDPEKHDKLWANFLHNLTVSE